MENFIQSLQGKTIDQLNELMFDCAEKGELEKVKFLLTSPTLNTHADISDTNDVVLINACISGNLKLVKYLLTSSELKAHSDINAQNDIALSASCSLGHFEIVKYLTSSPELKKHSHIPLVNGSDNNPVFLSGKHRHIEIFEYLVSILEEKDHHLPGYVSKVGSQLGMDKDLNTIKSFFKIIENKKPEITSSFIEGLIYGASSTDNVDAMKYVFSSPEIKHYVDIHQDEDAIFRSVLMWSRIGRGTDVARYFIFDLNIEETDKIKSLRASTHYEPIEKMFSVRNLTNTLEQDLPSSPNIKKSNKI